MSLNEPLARLNPRPSHAIQDGLLREAFHHGLSDTFTTRHPHTPAGTFHRSNTWTSPDNILISSTDRDIIHSSHIDPHPITSYGFDHAQLTTSLLLQSLKIHNPKRHGRPKFSLDRKQLYQDKVSSLLQDEPPSCPLERLRRLTAAAKSAQATVFIPRPHQPNKPKTITKAWRELRCLWQLAHRLEAGHNPSTFDLTNLPPTLNLPTTLDDVRQHIANTKDLLNEQARRQHRTTRRMFRLRRSDHFQQRSYGRFLDSALSRFSDFAGIVGFRPNDSPGIITSPDETKRAATLRITQTFFLPRIPRPDLSLDTLPAWLRKIMLPAFSPHQGRFNTITEPVDLPSLRETLQSMHKNKASGPSGLHAESLHYLDDNTLDMWLLPAINHCITTGQIPPELKSFHVWAIEKEPGVGSILSMTGKLNIRPISLFETTYKLIERIIQHRLLKALRTNNTMCDLQFGFTPQKGVDDLLLIYQFLLEDCSQYKKDIHISSNDCTQAYDSIPPWAMELIYRWHASRPPSSISS